MPAGCGNAIRIGGKRSWQECRFEGAVLNVIDEHGAVAHGEVPLHQGKVLEIYRELPPERRQALEVAGGLSLEAMVSWGGSQMPPTVVRMPYQIRRERAEDGTRPVVFVEPISIPIPPGDFGLALSLHASRDALSLIGPARVDNLPDFAFSGRAIASGPPDRLEVQVLAQHLDRPSEARVTSQEPILLGLTETLGHDLALEPVQECVLVMNY